VNIDVSVDKTLPVLPLALHTCYHQDRCSMWKFRSAGILLKTKQGYTVKNGKKDTLIDYSVVTYLGFPRIRDDNCHLTMKTRRFHDA
jgi:hypothetical protein